MSADEFENANGDDHYQQQQQRGECEIGSLEMPRSEWLFSAAATFQQNYGQVHPYLAAALCVIGTLMNAITILVLTRPSMRSPVNVLLSAVAVCDIVVMSSYLVFVVHFLLTAASRCEPSDFSYGWALFMIFHAHASVIFHAASIWMTVSLAQIRVLTIRRATAGPSSPLVTERFTVLLAVLMLCAMTLVNLPNFLTFEIMEVSSSSMLPCLHSVDEAELEKDDSQNATKMIGTAFSLNDTPINHTNAISNIQLLIISATNISNQSDHTTFTTTAQRMRRHRMISRIIRRNADPFGTKDPFAYTVRAHDSDCMKLKLAFWSNGMLFKVIPCLLLTLSIWVLLRIIAEVAHKRRNLAQVMRKKVVPKDHTTPMLAAVLLIFLLAELPQGLFLVLNGIFSAESFHRRVYLPLGDLMDLLSLLNSAVGFFIYVAMSRKFRTVFLQLLFSVLGFLTSKSAMDSSEKRSRTGEEPGAHQLWRRRTSGTSGASCLLSGAEQHSQQQQRQNGGGSVEIGENRGKRKRKKLGGTGGRRRWMSWRRRKMSGWTSTEITRTEQLSLCPNSLVGLPPLTLALSCSAGITAAAASVGVQLLHLEQPPPASAPSRRCSSHLSSVLLTLPVSSTHAIRRRTSSNSSAEDKSSFLQVPKLPSKMHPIGKKGKPKRAASLISLKGNDGERGDSAGGEQNNAQIMGKARKRISFNVPISGEGQQRRTEEAMDDGRRGTRRRENSAFGIIQQLRRWSTREGESGKTGRQTEDGVEKDTVLENGQERKTSSNASLLTTPKHHFKGSRRHGTFLRILDRWNGRQQKKEQTERETAIDDNDQQQQRDDQQKSTDQTDQLSPRGELENGGGRSHC